MGKTHKDYLSIIGNTFATTKNPEEAKWNRYYFLSYLQVVYRMIGEKRGAALDVGTSHGFWHSLLREKGLNPVFGVELDPERAGAAQMKGYDKVYNCDAASIPHSSQTIDVAIANDVFVHILQLKDKVAVLKEVERLLKPGGIFIFNHPVAYAHGYKSFHIQEHCSFVTLHEVVTLVTGNTSLRIVDIAPTYYHFRRISSDFVTKALRRLINFPFVPRFLHWMDYVHAKRFCIEESDVVYLKVVKPEDVD